MDRNSSNFQFLCIKHYVRYSPKFISNIHYILLRLPYFTSQESETPELLAVVTQLLNDRAEIRYGYVFSYDIFSTLTSDMWKNRKKTKVNNN